MADEENGIHTTALFNEDYDRDAPGDAYDIHDPSHDPSPQPLDADTADQYDADLENTLENSDQFVTLEIDSSEPDLASVSLALCKKYILKPYNFLLKLIGWRRLHSNNEKLSRFLSVFNVIYPIFIFAMLMFACIAQVVSCFSRTRSRPPVQMGSYYVLDCKDHLFTLDVITYVMILVSYLLAFYTFRIAEPEHLSTLAETSILSFNNIGKTKSRKKPVFILLALWSSGIVYFIYSLIVTITRLFTLRLHETNTIIGWFRSDNESAIDLNDALKISEGQYTAVHIIFVAFAVYGFIFFDLLYIAVFINYCSQCQLLTFYIDNLQDKVRNKKYTNLNMAIKEIRQVSEFLKILNGNISLITTLIFFLFVSSVILSYKELTENFTLELNIATGFLNTIQWLAAALLAALMAARLTSSGNEMRRIGQEIAARPFYYSDTPDLELHFFLTFTESTRYQAYLLFIPMQPVLVLGFIFIVLLFITSGTVFEQVNVVEWF